MSAELLARRHLPTGKPVSILGFGCSSIWAKPTFDPDEARRILDAATAEGINHFDTSPSYAEGEKRLGAFLQSRDASQLVISTKVGTEADHSRSFDPDRMRKSFDESLMRLGIEAVDILYLHGPSLNDLSQKIFSFFDRLKAERRIIFSGVNSFDPAIVAACVQMPIDAVMLQYSVSDRRFDNLIAELFARGKIVVAGTVLAQGIFDLKTFIPRNRNALWYLARALKNDPAFIWHGMRLARKLKRTGVGTHAAAIKFAVANPMLTGCLFGTSSLHHLQANTQAAHFPFTPEVVAGLIGVGKTGRS